MLNQQKTPKGWEERFNEEFVYKDLDDETGKRPNRVWRPTFQLPDRETRAIKSFIFSEIEKAKEEACQEREDKELTTIRGSKKYQKK